MVFILSPLYLSLSIGSAYQNTHLFLEPALEYQAGSLNRRNDGGSVPIARFRHLPGY